MGFLALGIVALIIGLSVVYNIKDIHGDESSLSSIEKLFYYISVFISFLVMMLNLNFLYVNIVKFAATKLNMTSAIGLNIFKIICLLAIFFIMQFILNKLFSLFILLIKPIYDNYNLPRALDYTISIVFGIIKGFVIVLIVFLGVSSYNNTFSYKKTIDVFSNLDSYKMVNSFVEDNKSVILYNDIKEYVPEDSVQVFYNGVPLDYGIESTAEIDDKAKQLTMYSNSDKEKAKAIYAWVGANITYDFNKATDVLGGKSVSDSGARAAWTTKSGICFDYACLYIAMARSIDLPVRLITGEASNGTEFGPHAWNQVYLEDEGKWINVDTTFYSNGDYFDTSIFEVDHIVDGIAGEWKN